jgi:hypothetical protein
MAWNAVTPSDDDDLETPATGLRATGRGQVHVLMTGDEDSERHIYLMIADGIEHTLAAGSIRRVLANGTTAVGVEAFS